MKEKDPKRRASHRIWVSFVRVNHLTIGCAVVVVEAVTHNSGTQLALICDADGFGEETIRRSQSHDWSQKSRRLQQEGYPRTNPKSVHISKQKESFSAAAGLTI